MGFESSPHEYWQTGSPSSINGNVIRQGSRLFPGHLCLRIYLAGLTTRSTSLRRNVCRAFRATPIETMPVRSLFPLLPRKRGLFRPQRCFPPRRHTRTLGHHHGPSRKSRNALPWPPVQILPRGGTAMPKTRITVPNYHSRSINVSQATEDKRRS